MKDEHILRILNEINSMINFKHPHLLGLFETYLDKADRVVIICEFAKDNDLNYALK